MLLPAAHAAVVKDFVSMRVFFYGAILFGMLTLLVALATAGTAQKNLARNQLLTLVAGFTILPLMFAVPLAEASPVLGYFDAWFEMISAFTTTGATLIEDPGLLSAPLHVWRASVAWMGGFLIWVAAISIFAPMNLGGFEVQSVPLASRSSINSIPQITDTANPGDRLKRYALQFLPIYFGLTIILWAGLVALGQVPHVALTHAMSTVSTSGISAVGGLDASDTSSMAELMIFVFLIFSITRLTFSKNTLGQDERSLVNDPELNVAFVLIAVTTLALFGRHFIAAGSESGGAISEIAFALWGTLFTVTSFLTTTGFVSGSWESATVWSGLQTPGLLLVGLALIGGGVATTAGGVKLLRVYALFRHSERELDRLLHPSSVGGGGRDARRIRKQGAYISWIFFMLFAISLAAVMVLLSLTGINFEAALVLAVAALSTTGPLITVAAETPISLVDVPDAAKLVLAAAMVLGRLEALALIALFNPDFWRE